MNIQLNKLLKNSYNELSEDISQLKETAYSFMEGYGEENAITRYIKNVFKIMDAYIDILLNPNAYEDRYIERTAHLLCIHMGILDQFLKVERLIEDAIE